MIVARALAIGASGFLALVGLGEGTAASSMRGRLGRIRSVVVSSGAPGRTAQDLVRRVGMVAAAAAAGAVGVGVSGLPGVLAAPLVAAVGARVQRGRRVRAERDRLERQLAELVESAALAVRTGFSVTQAIDYAGSEAEPPMAVVARRMAEEQRVGVPFDEALDRFGRTLGSEDARLFTLIVRIHAKSGGNLASALEEVAATIRHRISVRRELRAFTAQGRVSGAILGSLPIGFFLVLALTSRRELAPVYRSPAGIAMIVVGLAMELVAFLLIRRLLRVDV